jgi:hypothetical protein
MGKAQIDRFSPKKMGVIDSLNNNAEDNAGAFSVGLLIQYNERIRR